MTEKPNHNNNRRATLPSVDLHRNPSKTPMMGGRKGEELLLSKETNHRKKNQTKKSWNVHRRVIDLFSQFTLKEFLPGWTQIKNSQYNEVWVCCYGAGLHQLITIEKHKFYNSKILHTTRRAEDFLNWMFALLLCWVFFFLIRFVRWCCCWWEWGAVAVEKICDTSLKDRREWLTGWLSLQTHVNL